MEYFSKVSKIEVTSISDDNKQGIDKNNDKCPIPDIDLWKHFHKLRIEEIKNLWQRSVFLTAFISIHYAAYGHIIIKMFSESSVDIKEQLNLLAMVLCIIGISLSILWVAMAKGSKAWYELYEERISKIEKELHFKPLFLYNFGPETIDIQLEMDNCFSSTKGGPFSVSRINIMLGVIMLFIWIIAILCHFLCCIFKFKVLSALIYGPQILICVVAIAITIALIINVYSHKVNIISKTLNNCKKT